MAMSLILNEKPSRPADLVDRLVAEHGAWAVAAALAARLLRRRGPPPPRDLSALPDHLRRDIGLPVLPPHGPGLPPRGQGPG
jgi:hypothetical protein